MKTVCFSFKSTLACSRTMKLAPSPVHVTRGAAWPFLFRRDSPDLATRSPSRPASIHCRETGERPSGELSSQIPEILIGALASPLPLRRSCSDSRRRNLPRFSPLVTLNAYRRTFVV